MGRGLTRIDCSALEAWAGQGQHGVSCPVCSGCEFQILLTPKEIEAESEWLHRFYEDLLPNDQDLTDKADFTVNEPTYVVRCNECGTVLRNPQPTPNELSLRYRRDRYGRRTLEQLLECEIDFFREKVAAIDLPDSAQVLELGSFVGAFLLAAGERGWNATGLDIGEETTEFCQRKGLNVKHTSIDEADLAPSSFDALFIWNTFDQLAEPNKTLDMCHHALKDGGLLVVRVPNGDFETLRRSVSDSERLRQGLSFSAAFNNFLTFPYLCGYTRDSLARLLNAHDFGCLNFFGDSILPLFGRDCPDRARGMESMWKERTVRFAHRALKNSGHFLYPWMDVHAQKARSLG